MKLATFEINSPLGRQQRVGLVLGDWKSPNKVIDLNSAYTWLLAEQGKAGAKRLADVVTPPHMRAFIEMEGHGMAAARHVLETLEPLAQKNDVPTGLNYAQLVFDLGDVSLKTPISNPNSYRDFFAFEAHVAKGFELRKEPIPEAWYKLPVYYKGNHNSIIGPNETALWPNYTRKLDFELEIACVIGKHGRNIKASQASKHILGYSILNDISARDVQKYEMQCRLGPAKGKDFCSIIGPMIVTPDEIGDINNLDASVRINGDTISTNSSSGIYWSFEEMIERCSAEEDIYPSDIYGSGTLGNGCALEHGHWINPGDEIELEVEHLGILKNTIGSPSDQISPFLKEVPERARV